jgi:hypothetical protein
LMHISFSEHMPNNAQDAFVAIRDSHVVFVTHPFFITGRMGRRTRLVSRAGVPSLTIKCTRDCAQNQGFLVPLYPFFMRSRTRFS